MQDRYYERAIKEYHDGTGPIGNQQESKVEASEQENPAVNKLREAFDVARNAIVEGTELAKIVHDLQGKVLDLGNEVVNLQRDLEYNRNRNRELDEQVTQVRAARDQALIDAKRQEERAITAEVATSEMRRLNYDQGLRIEHVETSLANALRERDDAMVMALEYETKWKVAEAKLAKIEEAMHGVKSAEVAVEKPKPHWEEQPRDEVGKFQPTTYTSGSQSENGGF